MRIKDNSSCSFCNPQKIPSLIKDATDIFSSKPFKTKRHGNNNQ
jgi:hypothetical protein